MCLLFPAGLCHRRRYLFTYISRGRVRLEGYSTSSYLCLNPRTQILWRMWRISLWFWLVSACRLLVSRRGQSALSILDSRTESIVGLHCPSLLNLWVYLCWATSAQSQRVSCDAWKNFASVSFESIRVSCRPQSQQTYCLIVDSGKTSISWLETSY